AAIVTRHVRGPGRVQDLPPQGRAERFGEIDVVETSGTAVVNTVIPSIGVVDQLVRDGKLPGAELGPDYSHRIEREDVPHSEEFQGGQVRPVVYAVRGNVVTV